MAHYRLYFLNDKNHIRRAVSLECDDDASAIALINQHRDGHAMELWEGARRVARFKVDGSEDPAAP